MASILDFLNGAGGGGSAEAYDPFAAEKYANPTVGKILADFATLPKRAIESSQHSLDTGTYDPGPILEAAMLPLGAGSFVGAPARAGEQILGSGAVRKLPSDNYLGPISKHTDTLYREMAPSEALMDLPTSVSHGGSGPMGVQRKYYADHPDLATGQNGNRGVKVQYDSEPFDGIINSKKPAWDLSFQNGMGEYVAAPRPGSNIRGAVKGFEIDPSTLSNVEGAQYRRLLSNLRELGWKIENSKTKISAFRPD